MKLALALLAALIASAPALAQMRTDIPPLAEIDPLDPADAVIKRFAFTARGVMAQEFPIPNSQNMFCRLSNQYNVELNYYPASDEWIFQVQSLPAAQLAAGGIAICLDWKRAAQAGGK